MSLDLPEEQQPYYQKIVDLLSHYEDGWEVFINAHKADSFDYPLIRKPEFEDDPYLPKTWLELADKVISIVAVDKFKLDVLPNRIEIIRPDQMLDAYTSHGLPDSYSHWSFGKKREKHEKEYDASKNLSYEIVINSDPCLAYCMSNNTPIMQMLVIAHACYGHNAVFKNNYLFQEFTSTQTILNDVRALRNYVSDCMRNYGHKAVSDFLDSCHALEFMDMPDTRARKKLTEEERRARHERKQLARFDRIEPVDKRYGEDDELSDAFDKAHKKDETPPYHHRGEKNILGFMAENAPHLTDWQREIMRRRSELMTYFKPQMMTKMLNEGMATFTHAKILDTMFEIGLIDYGMKLSYRNSHDGVTFQLPSVVKRPLPNGETQHVFAPQSINPYALGFAMFEDIERICMDPTDEDREWFPHIAGNGDWLGTVIHAMESCSDETFVEQYLSPTVMRKFGFFTVEDLKENKHYEVIAVQSEDGFKAIRRQLARDYRFSEMFPDIRVHDYQSRTDRSLVLRHQKLDGRPLDDENVGKILPHLHRLWQHPVTIESVNDNGEVTEAYCSRKGYNYKEFTLKDPYMGYEV